MQNALNKIDPEAREVLVIASAATALVLVLTGIFWLAQNWNKQALSNVRVEEPAYATHGGGHGDDHGDSHGTADGSGHGEAGGH